MSSTSLQVKVDVLMVAFPSRGQRSREKAVTVDMKSKETKMAKAI